MSNFQPNRSRTRDFPEKQVNPLTFFIGRTHLPGPELCFSSLKLLFHNVLTDKKMGIRMEFVDVDFLDLDEFRKKR